MGLLAENLSASGRTRIFFFLSFYQFLKLFKLQIFVVHNSPLLCHF